MFNPTKIGYDIKIASFSKKLAILITFHEKRNNFTNGNILTLKGTIDIFLLQAFFIIKDNYFYHANKEEVIMFIINHISLFHPSTYEKIKEFV